MGKLYEELKRRKVFKVAVVYAVVAWLLVQIVTSILPTFEAPQWVSQTIILLLVLGFPITLIMAWAYEITCAGGDEKISATLRFSRRPAAAEARASCPRL